MRVHYPRFTSSVSFSFFFLLSMMQPIMVKARPARTALESPTQDL